MIIAWTFQPVNNNLNRFSLFQPAAAAVGVECASARRGTSPGRSESDAKPGHSGVRARSRRAHIRSPAGGAYRSAPSSIITNGMRKPVSAVSHSLHISSQRHSHFMELNYISRSMDGCAIGLAAVSSHIPDVESVHPFSCVS